MVDYTRKKIKVTYRSPHDIIPYEKNARTHKSEIEFLCNSIKEHGFDVGHAIGVDKDGVIIYGHGRRLAAIKLGMKEVPVVVRSDLSPEQVKAYRLADNKISDLSGWDFDLLDLELDELKIMDIDMTQFGFDDPDIFTESDDDRDGFGIDDDEDENGKRKKDMNMEVYNILIKCDGPDTQMELFNEMVDRGFDCQIIN